MRAKINDLITFYVIIWGVACDDLDEQGQNEKLNAFKKLSLLSCIADTIKTPARVALCSSKE